MEIAKRVRIHLCRDHSFLGGAPFELGGSPQQQQIAQGITYSMPSLEELKSQIPEAAKDLRINLGNVLSSEHLAADQAWGVALASAYFLRCRELVDAILAEASHVMGEAVMEDAKAAAALMGMNTVFYRFRYMVGKEGYAQRPARLRMQRIGSPTSSKVNLELFSLACAALAGCQDCVRSHEQAVLHGGLREEHVHDCIRIAAVLQGVAIGAFIAQTTATP